jgi:D-alanyl-D-alanine carboxypeptidase
VRHSIPLLCLLLLAACTAPEPLPTATPPAELPPLATLPPPAASLPPAAPPAPPTVGPSPTHTLTPPSPAGPALPAEEQLAVDVQALLDDWLANSGAPGAVLGLRLPDGRTIVAAAGQTDDAGGFPIAPEHRFRIGSITKSFVAVLLVQLSEEGLVGLDEPLAAYLDWAPHAQRVTLRQLLAHTSGMPDFALEADFREQVLAEPGRSWTARETVELVAQRELLFEPDSRWSYSNTNYTLAGLVAEAVTGRQLAELLRERILVPAGLSDTYLEGLEEAPPIETAGHFDIDGDGRAENVRVIPYTALVTSGAAAGGLSSTAADVLAFAGSLADGQLLSRSGLEALTTASEVSPAYGLGLGLFQRAGRTFWGHGGALPGYVALMAHAPAERVSVVALANQSGVDLQGLLEDAYALTEE